MSITLDQAIHELKMGRAVRIGKSAFMHPEYAAKLPAGAKLIITGKRAFALTGKNFKGNTAVNLKGKKLPSLQTIISGKTKADCKSVNNADADAAIKLAALGELLPAVIQFSANTKTPEIKKSDIKKAKDKLILTAEAPLKLRDCGTARIYAYRAEGKISEHLAIVVGKPGNNPLVRVHSCCYTGDLLGSLSCDCRDQLRGALQLMHRSGGGILVYLMQEGRGIGLVNKLRAYDLQANGLDTVQANEFLGFDDEERAFAPAAAILKKLGIKNISLISNNPKKAKELEAEGIKVAKLVPMIIEHEHNRNYLVTKRTKSGQIGRAHV